MTGVRFPIPQLLLGSVLLGLASAAAAAPVLNGRWLTDDGKGVVEIGRCGTHLCGRIVKVLDAGPRVPTTDLNNPDPVKRARPLVGTVVLSGFSEAVKAWTGGRAYDPKSGKSYNSRLSLNSDGSLKVTGCVLILCRSVRWTRYT